MTSFSVQFCGDLASKMCAKKSTPKVHDELILLRQANTILRTLHFYCLQVEKEQMQQYLRRVPVGLLEIIFVVHIAHRLGSSGGAPAARPEAVHSARPARDVGALLLCVYR